MNRKGFTLTEVLVTIIIISVIMLIAVPSIIAINKRINKRLFESKKELIVLAAEQFGNDNLALFDTSPNSEITVSVGELILYTYLPADKDKKGICENSEYSSVGCVFNPEDDSILNDVEILLIRQDGRVMAHYGETINGDKTQNITHTICEKLNKDGVNQNNEKCSCYINAFTDEVYLSEGSLYCYFTSEDPDNWLYYSEQYFRILGIEKVNDKYYTKIITDDVI